MSEKLALRNPLYMSDLKEIFKNPVLTHASM